MQQQMNKMGWFEGRGEVTKAPLKDVVKEEGLPPSPIPEFNPNVVANGLVDHEDEGGRAPARSTGITGMNDKLAPGDALGFSMPEEKEKYELSQFVVKYTVPGSKGDIASNDVRVYFSSIDAARKVVVGKNYTHKTPSGEIIECEVIRGAPTIAYNEVSKMNYIDGEWKRL